MTAQGLENKSRAHKRGYNAEACPGCFGTNPPYPFICPGDDRYRPSPEAVAEEGDGK